MTNKPKPFDFAKNLRTALLRTLLLPILLLIFFLVAPSWYESHLHSEFRKQISASQKLSDAEKAKRIAYFDTLDFQSVCSAPLFGYESLHNDLEKDGVCATFDRLWWGQVASVVLFVLLVASMLSILSLNLDARKSAQDLVRNYRLGWQIAMSTALIKLVLLIPLLTYGTFEFTVLLFGAFLPKLLILIVVGGLIGLWTSVQVLLRKVPMEIAEPMSRQITPEDAPELWDEVRKAAQAVGTAPPDRLIMGLKLNFFVTEVAVKTDTSLVTGRTLFLSIPLLKHFSRDEVLAVIGHELGHFKGKDTAITRVFGPLRAKVNGTIAGLARSGFAGRPSLGLLSFFTLTFERTIQQMSRIREFAADKVGASLTSPEAIGRSLIKQQVYIEAVQRIAADPVASKEQNLMEIGLQGFIREKLLPEDPLWAQLAEKKLPHPLDTHPPLQDRLDALGGDVKIQDARQIALEEPVSAYAVWFANRDALFGDLARQAGEMMGKVHVKAELANANYETDAGKSLLDLHFPEKRWQKKQGPIWTFIVIFGLLCLICTATLILVPVVVARIVLGLLALLLGWIVVAIWMARKDELIVNAREVYYPTWKRPLRFDEVTSVEVRRINSTLALKFNLKEPRKPLAKWKLPVTTKATLLYLGGSMTEKPLAVAQTVYRYYHRLPQTAPTNGNHS